MSRLAIRLVLVALVAALSMSVGAGARTRTETQKPAARAPAKPSAGAKPAAAAGPKTEEADAVCPSALGAGVTSKRQYCDVLISRNPGEGIIVRIPPHRGPATLSFDLHNRHTYSEEQVKAGKAFAIYTATMGVLTMDGTLLTRGVVRSEFRTARDLVDRIGGGAGPGGVKAVAPTGTEPILVEIPENVTEVSLLGERLTVQRYEGTETFSTAGRPIAVVSRVTIEYTPPASKPAVKKPAPKKPAAPPKK